MDARWLCRCQWPTGFSSPVLHPFGIGVTLPVLPEASPARSGHSPTGAPGGPRGVSGRQGAHGRPGPVLPARTFCLSLSGCSTRAVWGPRVSVWRGDGPQRGTLGAWGCARPGCPPRGRRPARVGQRRCPAPDRAARARSHNKRGLRRWRRQTPLDLGASASGPPAGQGCGLRSPPSFCCPEAPCGLV